MPSNRMVGFLCLLLYAGMPVVAGAGSPLSMKGPDGQGLDLRMMEMKVALHGPLSLTEMDMVFFNPRDRQVEGKFTCTLPTGATISRFAKEVYHHVKVIAGAR